ncbi:MAG: hypothetical protein ACHP78_05165 [Terriglobales bacterium]
MNQAELLVYTVCRQSFLSLWSYMNPRTKPFGKELCDVLVVCEPDIIIFSVKQTTLGSSGDSMVDARRWRRRAVDASSAQIYGAERSLRSLTHVIKSDNSLGFPLPKQPTLHRVAVALGSQGEVSLPFGDFGKGFVHVLDELSFTILLNELDTITDFVRYLSDKEQLFRAGASAAFEGSEEDLLATYLHNGRKFPENYDVVLAGSGLWDDLREKAEYGRKQIADQDSYVWDRLIESFCHDLLNDQLEFAPSPSQTESAIRTMAKEDRFSRRILGRSFREFIDESSRVRSRMLRSPSDVMYVFLAMPLVAPRDFRVAELGNRCFVARGLNPDATTVVGLATEQYGKGQGFSFDLIHLHKPTWSSEDQVHMEAMQSELGYFASPRTRRAHEDEYPQT